MTVRLQRCSKKEKIYNKEEKISNKIYEHFYIVSCKSNNCFNESSKTLQIIDVDFVVSFEKKTEIMNVKKIIRNSYVEFESSCGHQAAIWQTFLLIFFRFDRHFPVR